MSKKDLKSGRAKRLNVCDLLKADLKAFIVIAEAAISHYSLGQLTKSY